MQTPNWCRRCHNTRRIQTSCGVGGPSYREGDGGSCPIFVDEGWADRWVPCGRDACPVMKTCPDCKGASSPGSTDVVYDRSCEEARRNERLRDELNKLKAEVEELRSSKKDKQ